MKPLCLTVATFFLYQYSLFAQEQDLFYLYSTKLINESANVVLTTAKASSKKPFPSFDPFQFLQLKEAGKGVLHYTKKGNPVEAFFFPGISDKKALVIGGLHGSELSSIEVATALIRNLKMGEMPYYNVIVIPSVFPDNAQAAKEDKNNRIQNNTGRYSNETTADPNRQMPLPGRPFTPDYPFDAVSREIEEENRALLQLIQLYRPDRLIAIHAIKDYSKAGIFADPRTDCFGNALGFETDKALALMMAKFIQDSGGACPGNHLNEEPTALYHLDPPVAETGQKQDRSFHVSNLQGRGRGVSLGTWASTAVCDGDAETIRPAIRTFTMEFPGCMLPSEYKTTEDQQRFAKMIDLYATSIQQFFLHSLYVEENTTEGKLFAVK